MLAPDYSFILHTVNPINHNPLEVYVEIAVGLGETLASAATRGSPYRMVCDRPSGAATTAVCRYGIKVRSRRSPAITSTRAGP